MSYRNERFQRGFLSLDLVNDGDNPEKRDILSDHGEGARRIRSFCEGRAEDGTATHRGKCIAEARRKLADAGLGRLIPVLDQVVENGRNRQESICRLAVIWRLKKSVARVKYYRGVDALLMLFQPMK